MLGSLWEANATPVRLGSVYVYELNNKTSRKVVTYFVLLSTYDFRSYTTKHIHRSQSLKLLDPSDGTLKQKRVGRSY